MPVLTLVAVMGIAGCNLLEVDNPNNVSQDALSNPASAGPQVDGVVAALARGIETVLSSYSTVSDELTWIGSRDAWQELDRGTVHNPFNEFINEEEFYMNQARWQANATVVRLEGFESDGTLDDPSLLAMANLYDAITYDYIANMYDDWVIASDRTEAGPPIGPANMASLYDSAMAAVDRGLAIETGNSELRGQLLAIRARAQFDRGVWQLLNPSGTTPANPLVNSPGAASDAQAALAILPTDYRMKLELPSSDLRVGDNSLAAQVNSRQELAYGPRYATYDFDTKTLTVFLKDPVDTTIASPGLTTLIQEFIDGDVLSPITVTGSRDLMLIIAENALANNDMATFTSTINQLRALDQLPPWNSGSVSALAILQYERMANLYLQGRRLNDMYRFGITAPIWADGSDAKACPGSLFPISITERQSNPNITTQPACGQ